MRPEAGIVLGLATFLCGIFLLRGALRTFEPALRPILARELTSPLRGVVAGALAAALLQSSSATNAVAVAMAGGGLLSLRQGVSLVLGANIGTTVTAQLAAFNSERFGLLALLLGMAAALVGRGRVRWGGWALFGLGGLLFGLDLMEEALRAGGESGLVVLRRLGDAGDGAALAVGALVTAIVQSSSAVTATLIALAEAEAVAVRPAIAAALGSNVGTVVTTLIAGFASGLAARRVAVADLLFNAAGAALFLPLLPALLSVVGALSNAAGRQIANAHTLFNLATVALLLPFIDPYCAALERLLPGKER